MWRHPQLGAAEAIALVRGARPCARPNQGFRVQLVAWERGRFHVEGVANAEPPIATITTAIAPPPPPTAQPLLAHGEGASGPSGNGGEEQGKGAEARVACDEEENARAQAAAAGTLPAERPCAREFNGS